MVCEMSHSYDLLVPLMLVCILTVAILPSRWTLYEEQVTSMIDSPAHLGDFVIDVLARIHVRDVYKRGEFVQMVPEEMPLRKIMQFVARANSNYFPVVDEEKCVACNDCVVACPLDLFSLQPISHKLWVACKSLTEGDEALADCEVACTACARCVADAPDGLISIKNNLATIDYSRNPLASRLPIQRCPTGAIVWLENQTITKGPAAKHVLRKEPLPIEPTP